MLLSPKKSKFLKSFASKKINYKKNTYNPNLNFGHLCLIANQPTRLTNFQLEAIRVFLRRYLKKSSQMFFKLFPNLPITKKPNEIRLGCGKGNVKYWSFNLKKGDIIVEICSSSLTKKSSISLNASRLKLSAKSFVFNKHLR